MTSLLISVLLALLLVLSVLYWQQLEKNEQQEEKAEDDRIRPLLQGLNYLLADEPDLALQEVVKVARLRSEATEVYMFLGEMFRNRGEFGRAVRIHQNILARPHVDADLYIQTQFALATDFHKGGLIDRAVRHYRKVLDGRSDHLEALHALLEIYESSHEWEQALDLLQRIDRLKGEQAYLHQAYLLSELANRAYQQQDDQCEVFLRQSLSTDQQCVHAHVMAVRLAIERHQPIEPVIQAMAEAVPASLFLLIPLLDEQQRRVFLLPHWKQQRHYELALSWLEYCAKKGGREAASQLSTELLFQAEDLPSSLRLYALLGEDERLRQQAQAWRAELKRFACRHCGIAVAELRWQCPQCHHWGAIGLAKDLIP